MALAMDIADAVVAELASGSFSQAIAPQRMVLPQFGLEELADLRVTVVPKAVEVTGSTRSVCQHDVQIDIGVQQKLATGDDAEIDALMGLVEEIAEFVRATRQFGDAVWVKTENVPIYSQEHLGELRQFASVLTLTLRVMTT